MMKLQLIYLALWSVSDAAYMSRMAIINHNQMNRVRPTAFRPGVMLRPWNPRLVQAASHRVPYVFYRNAPQRYSIKHYTPPRVISSPWKATRLQTALPTSTEYEFVRAASAPPAQHADGGAIHTIPAPNLSLSEKPIVVLDNDNHGKNPSSVPPKIYEVTEKYPDQSEVQVPAKIEQPIGFSKATSLTSSELQSLVRNNAAALQYASDLGLSAIALPQSAIAQSLLSQQTIIPQQQHNGQVGANILAQSLVPQQFALQSFNSLPNPQDMIQASPDGIVISPSALYQPDPGFLQKLQTQLLQRFPGVEFVPYAADVQQVPPQNLQAHSFHIPNVQNQNELHNLQVQHFQNQPELHNVHEQDVQNQNAQQSVIRPVTVPPQNQQQQPFYLLQNEQFTRPAPSTFVAAEAQNSKNVIQRETQEGTVVTLVPQIVVTNATEKEIEVTSATTPQNMTLELVAAESHPDSTTIKYFIETTTEKQKTTPVLFAQVDSQGSSSNINLVPVGFSVQNAGNNAPATQNGGYNGPVAQNVGYNGPLAHSSDASPQNNGSNSPITQSTPAGFNIQYVQPGQNAGNVVTNGFYSAINDVRAAAALAQVEKPQEETNPQENITTTTNNPTSTISADLQTYFVKKRPEANTHNKTSEIKHTLGVPFAKTQNSVNVAYTLLRSDDKDSKVAKDGSVYAGQLVEASVSEDTDFNVQKSNLLTRRAPIRLVAVPENKETTTTTTTVRVPAKLVVKAKIPPKSKLTYDDKTGEPVLRIYASYVDSPAQREAIVAKLSNMKRVKEVVGRKQDSVDNWTAANIKSLAKPFEPNPNQVSQFGLKLKSRSDDYVPLFEEYEY